ncbi:MAG: CHASE3 domain-containing protein, partial [Bacteroidia bacterium]
KSNHRTTYFKLKLVALLALFLGIGLFATSKYITELTNSDLNEANQWVVHTQQVVILTNEIKVQVQGMQNNSRGYLLSSEPDFLESAKLHQSQALEAIKALGSLIHKNQNQAEKLKKLKNDLVRYDAYQTELFNLAGEGDIEGAIAEFKTYKGKELVDEIMRSASEIEAYENQIMQGRTTSSQKLFILLDQINLAISLLASGILFLSFIFIFRALSNREKDEEKLQEEVNLNQHLLDEIPVSVVILDSNGELFFLNSCAKKNLLPFGEKEINAVLDLTLVNNKIKHGEQTPLSSLIRPALKGVRAEYPSLSREEYPDHELSLLAEPVKGIQNGSDFIIVVIQDLPKK